MKYEEFKADVEEGIKKYPNKWRYGQKVFNYINVHYYVAVQVQFEDKIDCFYDDKLVTPFIILAYKHLSDETNKINFKTL